MAARMILSDHCIASSLPHRPRRGASRRRRRIFPCPCAMRRAWPWRTRSRSGDQHHQMRGIGFIQPGGELNPAIRSIGQGAATSVWAATAPELAGRGGLVLETAAWRCPLGRASIPGMASTLRSRIRKAPPAFGKLPWRCWRPAWDISSQGVSPSAVKR